MGHKLDGVAQFVEDAYPITSTTDTDMHHISDISDNTVNLNFGCKEQFWKMVTLPGSAKRLR